MGSSHTLPCTCIGHIVKHLIKLLYILLEPYLEGPESSQMRCCMQGQLLSFDTG